MSSFERGSALLEAVATIDRLRSAGGCPWYAAQTHASLAPYAIEEAHEVADAAETGDAAALADELGDLLLQVLIHARIAQETPAGGFDIDDVARGLTAKMVRRNPHVFGDARAETVEQVHELYDAVKADEKQRAHVLDDIPASLPALARAQKVVSRLRKAGDPPSSVPASVEAPDGESPAERIGAALLALTIEADAAGVDAEAALREATRDLERGHGG